MRARPASKLLSAVTLALLAGGATAQIDGNRGVAPIDSGGAYEVSGVSVDVAAKTPEAARLGGWRLAQRRAWVAVSNRLGGGGGLISDGALDSIVSGIVVEEEQIGPTRYVAKLGVLFNRARAASILGISTYTARSSPMLVIPVIHAAGVGTVFEQRNPWQEAWARFRTGNSTIDYVRPSGTGPDSLLLNTGQIGRPGRGWWRTILNQYGATDILIPVVTLYRQWPGGPVIGVFQARYGPDNETLDRFTLRVGSADGLAQLLDTGVRRLDTLYQAAVREGQLRPDASLLPMQTQSETAAQDAAENSVAAVGDEAAAGPGIPVVVQFDTPNAGVVSATENAIRGLVGVRSATTTSLALGGVSLLRVVYDGDPAALRTALEARGFQVFGEGQTLRIRRAPQLLPPDLPTDDATTR